MATTFRSGGYTVDADLELKTAGLVAASANGPTIVDFGGTEETFHGDLVVDVSAIEIDTSDEIYTIILEGSDSATLASGVEELACLRLGDNVVLTGNGDTDSTAGRYIVPFVNERNGRHYRYARLYTLVVGTVATGIDYAAYIGVKRR